VSDAYVFRGDFALDRHLRLVVHRHRPEPDRLDHAVLLEELLERLPLAVDAHVSHEDCPRFSFFYLGQRQLRVQEGLVLFGVGDQRLSLGAGFEDGRGRREERSELVFFLHDC